MRPAIVIGVGGLGSSVVRVALDRLTAAADLSENPEAAKDDLGNNLRFYAIDTITDVNQAAVGESEFGRFVSLGNYTRVDATVQALLQGRGDPFFPEWWPFDFRTPGDIISGAGHVRLKGKLAYYLFRQNAGDVVSEIERGIGELAPPAAGIMNLPIYIVCSLSGGTGSGIFLSLAQELKERITTPILEIFGMVMDGVWLAEAETDSIRKRMLRSNCCTALAEIDLWDGPEEDHKEEFRPFFVQRTYEVRGVSGSPFVAVFLFQKGNSSGNFTQVIQGIQHMAECLTVQVRSDTGTTIAGHWSNVATEISDREGALETRQSIRFGSMGMASLRFPASHVLDYLAHLYAPMVLEECLIAPTAAITPGATEDARAFIDSHNLYEAKQHQLSRQLLNPVEGVTLPKQSNPLKALLRAREQVAQVLREQKELHDARYHRLAATTQMNIERLVQEVMQSLDEHVLRLLSSGDPYAAVRTHQFVRCFKDELGGEARALGSERDGKELEGRKGLLGKIDELTQSEGERTKELQNVLRRRFPLGGKREAAQNFVNTWWHEYVGTKERMHLVAQCLDVYNRLAEGLNRHLVALSNLQDLYLRLASRFRQEARACLAQGQDELADAFPEMRVLDEPEHVLKTFPLPEKVHTEDARVMLSFEGNSVPWALALYRRAMSQLTGMRFPATEPTAPMDYEERFARDLLATCRARFRDEVLGYSVWTACQREAELRGVKAGKDTLNFICDRVRSAAHAARPFWILQDRALSEPIPLVVAFYSFEALGGLDETLGADMSSKIEQALRDGFGRQCFLNDCRDRFALVCCYQEVGIKLCELQEDWRRTLQKAYRASIDSRAWTDFRYADGRLPVMAAPETEADTLYLLGLAFSEGLLVIKDGQIFYGGGGWITRHESLGQERDLRRFVAILQRDELKLEQLTRDTNAIISAKREKGRSEVSRMLDRAREELQRKASESQGHVKEMYDLMAQEIIRRLEWHSRDPEGADITV